MLAATSCRNAVLNAAASSKVSGGTSRVLVLPGSEAFAITAMPQDARPDRSFVGATAMRMVPQGLATEFDRQRTAPAIVPAARKAWAAALAESHFVVQSGHACSRRREEHLSLRGGHASRACPISGKPEIGGRRSNLRHSLMRK